MAPPTMRAFVLAIVLAQAACVLSVRPVADAKAEVSAPKPPQWAKSYMVEYTYTLPYTAKLQPDPVRCGRWEGCRISIGPIMIYFFSIGNGTQTPSPPVVRCRRMWAVRPRGRTAWRVTIPSSAHPSLQLPCDVLPRWQAQPHAYGDLQCQHYPDRHQGVTRGVGAGCRQSTCVSQGVISARGSHIAHASDVVDVGWCMGC